MGQSFVDFLNVYSGVITMRETSDHDAAKQVITCGETGDHDAAKQVITMARDAQPRRRSSLSSSRTRTSS